MENKEKYERVSVEVLSFDNKDIITTSSESIDGSEFYGDWT